MKRYITILLCVCAMSLHAQTFQEANDLYAAADYEGAISAYTAVLADSPSAEVYYNLGNAYFKTGELAQSILAYERALRLKPNYKDAQYNLEFAEQRITDNIEDNHTFFLSAWWITLRNQLSAYTWMLTSIALFVLCLIGLFLFAFLHTVWVRKTAFHGAWIALLICICTLSFSLSLVHRDNVREEAIITQGVVNAKASPDKSGTDLFVLHEGTKVRIKDSVNGWLEIHVGGNIGWVKSVALERI